MHELNDKALTGLIVEETGQPADSNVVRLVHSSIKHLKAAARFDDLTEANPAAANPPVVSVPSADANEPHRPRAKTTIGLNLVD